MKIQTSFLNLLNSLVDKNHKDRNFFVTFEIEQENNEKFGKDYSRIPQGLLIKYSAEKSFDNYTTPEFEYKVTDRNDYHHTFIMNAYYNGYLNRANYLMNNSKFDEAEILIQKAAEVKPTAPEAKKLLSKLSQLKDLQKSGNK